MKRRPKNTSSHIRNQTETELRTEAITALRQGFTDDNPGAAEAKASKLLTALEPLEPDKRLEILRVLRKEPVIRSRPLLCEPVDPRSIRGADDADGATGLLMLQLCKRLQPRICKNLQDMGWSDITPFKLKCILSTVQCMESNSAMLEEFNLGRVTPLCKDEFRYFRRDLARAVIKALDCGAIAAAFVDRRSKGYRMLKDHLPELAILLRNALRSFFMQAD